LRYLILIRHSQTDASENVPKHAWDLTEEGQRRAQALVPLLEAYHPFVLASSPEAKAQQTAKPIAQHYNLDMLTVTDLREHDRDNVKWMNSQEEFRASVIHFFEHPDELVLGEETGRQTLTRFTSAVTALIDGHSGLNIVAVTHGSVITLFVSQFAGVDAVLFWQSLTQPWIGVFTVPEFYLLKVHNEFE
jgi:broad specificity phosphatase PhoE